MVVLNVDTDTWRTLRDMDDSLKFMGNDEKYTLAVKKTKSLKKFMIQEIYECSH